MLLSFCLAVIIVICLFYIWILHDELSELKMDKKRLAILTNELFSKLRSIRSSMRESDNKKYFK